MKTKEQDKKVMDAEYEVVPPTEDQEVKTKENALQKLGRWAMDQGDKQAARKREKALRKAEPKKSKKALIVGGIVVAALVAGGAAIVHTLAKAADISELEIDDPEGETDEEEEFDEYDDEPEATEAVEETVETGTF